MTSLSLDSMWSLDSSSEVEDGESAEAAGLVEELPVGEVADADAGSFDHTGEAFSTGRLLLRSKSPFSVEVDSPGVLGPLPAKTDLMTSVIVASAAATAADAKFCLVVALPLL